MSHHPVANLLTIRDVTRWAMSEMERNAISLGHGTADFWEEATFLVMRTLKLPFDRLETFWGAHLTPQELEEVLCNIDLRVHMKKPVPYLIKEGWLSDHCFYVDERVLIPRSFILKISCTTLPADGSISNLCLSVFVFLYPNATNGVTHSPFFLLISRLLLILIEMSRQ